MGAVSAGSLPTDEQINRLLDAAGQDAALVLQRVMPTVEHMERLRHAFVHLIFDIDDAIYCVPPDLQSSRLTKTPKRLARLVVRGSPYASARKRPLERTLARVDACVVGNSILAHFARRHARRVVEIPTTIQPVGEAP